MMPIKKENIPKFKFYCAYCGNVFQQHIRIIAGSGKHSLSDQVKCPSCNNFLKNKEGVEVE